jgi:hypothetical protein
MNVDENNRRGLLFWDNWTDVHWGFSAVWQFTKADMAGTHATTEEICYIAPVIGSLLCFMFFGMSEETLIGNRRLLQWLWARLACTKARSDASVLLPVHQFVHLIRN